MRSAEPMEAAAADHAAPQPASSNRSASASASAGQKSAGRGWRTCAWPGAGRQDTTIWSPLHRQRLAAVHGAEQRAADGRIRVGVAASAHRGDAALLRRRRVAELEQGILEGDEHPALLPKIIGRRLGRGPLDGAHDGRLAGIGPGPVARPGVGLGCARPVGHGVGHRRGEDGRCPLADRVRAGEPRVGLRGLGDRARQSVGSFRILEGPAEAGAVFPCRQGRAPRPGQGSSAVERALHKR